MGTSTTSMALSTLFHDSPSLFPRMISRHPFFSPRSHNFPRPFDLFNESSHLFDDMQQRQEAFLLDMGDGSTAESTAAQQGSRSYSYSSTMVRHGDGDAVTHQSEQFHGPNGQVLGRTKRQIGDRMVEETRKGDETTRTLTGLTEGELEHFHDQHREQASMGWFNARGFPVLTDRNTNSGEPRTAHQQALEGDLQRVQQEGRQQKAGPRFPTTPRK